MKDINHVLYEKETRLEQLDKHIKVLRAAAKIVSASEPVDVGLRWADVNVTVQTGGICDLTTLLEA
jgi:hypothetical protein